MCPGSRGVKTQEVNWIPWSEWITVPAVGCRLLIAVDKALVTSAVCEESMDEPTTRRG
jgi:hypothetical protein